ncbi:MAG: hypothetical protein ACI8T1_003107 [Verrucomicrobiales bacterium]|jgi:hypothetical protein
MNPPFHNPDLKPITAGLSPPLLEFHPANLTEHLTFFALCYLLLKFDSLFPE